MRLVFKLLGRLNKINRVRRVHLRRNLSTLAFRRCGIFNYAQRIYRNKNFVISTRYFPNTRTGGKGRGGTGGKGTGGKGTGAGSSNTGGSSSSVGGEGGGSTSKVRKNDIFTAFARCQDDYVKEMEEFAEENLGHDTDAIDDAAVQLLAQQFGFEPMGVQYEKLRKTTGGLETQYIFVVQSDENVRQALQNTLCDQRTSFVDAMKVADAVGSATPWKAFYARGEQSYPDLNPKRGDICYYVFSRQIQAKIKTLEKPRKYAVLPFKHQCIYQAFAECQKDTPQEMGAFVNEQNIDADNGLAVEILADKFNFKGRGVKNDPLKKENFDATKEYVLVLNADKNIINELLVNNLDNTRSYSDTMELADKAAKDTPEAEWHAIYAYTDANNNFRIIDAQKEHSSIVRRAFCYYVFERQHQAPSKALPEKKK